MLLLNVALDSPDAVEAWRLWKERVEFQEIDHPSMRLLPLVYRTLRNRGLEDPLLPRLKGVYLRSLYQQSLLLGRVREVLEEWDRKEVAYLLMKGIPLSLVYYGGLGLRPMGDVDILIHRQDLRSLVRLLRKGGWSPHFRDLDEILEKDAEAFTETVHACHFYQASDRAPDGRFFCIDLHWTALDPSSDRSVDDGFWRDAVEFECRGSMRKTLCPTDQFLHVVAHGFPGNEMPTLRWIPDAILVLRAAEIDWERFCREAARRFVSARCARALDFLREEFQAEVPESVVEHLNRQPRRWFDRRYLTLTMRDPSVSGPLGIVERMFLRALRTTRGRLFRSFGLFLRNLRLASSHSEQGVPRWIVKRSWARMKNLLHRSTNR